MEPGERIADRFRVERRAGAGGMGAVYRARDGLTGGHVAIKVLHATSTPDAAERFARECVVLAGLSHPGVVRYVAHGITPGGDPWLAMEWLEGEDLAARLRARPLTPREAVRVVRRAAEAVALAHRRGIVHRDLKPSNLFLSGGALEAVKVLDFGIARALRDGRALTLTGAAIGTPGYMSPEQARGERELTPASDVFALGAVLFECLAGRPPFVGDSVVAVLAKILFSEPPRLRDAVRGASPALDALLAGVLAREPAERPADAAALVAALDTLTDADLAYDGVPRAVDEAPREALTDSEQRVVCVVLAGDAEDPRDGDDRGGRVDHAGEPGRAPAQAHPSGTDDTQPTVLEPPGVDARAALRSAVADLGARVELLANGAVVASVTGSAAPTDQAARAARCALVVAQLRPDLPVALVTGRGVLAGQTPVGDVIDRGVRSLRGARRGVVRVDEATLGLLDARFDVVAAPGETGYVLRGERDPLGGARTLLGRATACTGRDRELATLAASFAECADERVARAVLLTGPAGGGKSRVLQEFLRRLPGGEGAPAVLVGRAEPTAAGASFALVSGALRRAAGAHAGDAPTTVRDKLRARVGRRVSPAEAPRVAAFLCELCGVPLPDDAPVEAVRAARADAMVMGDAMRAAWEDLLAAECDAQAVLLVLDDLQWGDVPSVRFVDAALRHLRDRPLMVVALARPEVHQVFPGLWSERDLQELRLPPLSRRAAERLLRDALGERADAATVDKLVERAEGNPFYLEELVRAVAAGAGDALPDTVLGMVQARLDALGAEGKRVLRAGSVFGQRFGRDGLAALLGADLTPAVLSDWLEELCAREVLTRRGAPRADDAEFAFAHTLLREAAYGLLTAEDRTLGHRLAGDWLARHAAADPRALAEHFVLGERPERAVEHFLRAAEQSLGGNDLATAAALAERGLACGAQGEARGRLQLLLAEVHRWRGELADGCARAEQATGELAQGTSAWFQAVSEVITDSGRLGRFADVERWVREAAFEPGARDAAGMKIVCLGRGVVQLLNAGRQLSADPLIEEVDALVGDPSALDRYAAAWVHNFRAARALRDGDLGADLREEEAALRAFDEAGNVRTACNARVNLGHAYAELGDLERAEELLRQALAAAERMGLRTVVALALQNLGHVLLLSGRADDARAAEQRAAEIAATQGSARLLGGCGIYLAQVALAAGDAAGAVREAGRAMETLADAAPMRAVAQAVYARALLGAGRAGEARDAATEAVLLLESLGGIEEGGTLVRLVFAEALAAPGGDRRAARSAAGRARDAVLERAARIETEALRASFLTRVPDNARALALPGELEA